MLNTNIDFSVNGTPLEMRYDKMKTANKGKKQRSLASFPYIHAFESNQNINRIMR